jgi:ankyrin repeat protein
MCRLLLKHGANISCKNAADQTPLHLAAQRRETNGDVVQILLNAAAPINAQDKRGLSALHEAANGNSVEIVKLLIRNGANVNIKNNDGLTPLHVVTSSTVQSSETRLAIARSLLDAHAAINAVNNQGETPLHLATWSGLDQLVALYLQAGAEPSLEDNAGRTALSIASSARHPSTSIIQQLASSTAAVSGAQVSTIASKNAKVPK